MIFLILFAFTCKEGEVGEDGKDGSDGQSYFTVTWTTEPDIFFMGADPTTDIPLPNKGVSRQRDVTADDGTGPNQHTVFYYSSS